MTRFVDSLHRGLENRDHLIYAPQGGLFGAISDVLLGMSTHFDLEISRDGATSYLRVIPRYDELVEDPPGSKEYRVSDALGVFLDETKVQTDNWVSLSCSINTGLTRANCIVGLVRMRAIHSPIEEQAS